MEYVDDRTPLPKRKEDAPGIELDYDLLADKIALRLFAMLVSNHRAGSSSP